MYHHTDLFHIIPVFFSFSLMGNRSGLHVYLYGTIYFLSLTQKHHMLILIRSHWARLVQGLLAAMNMVIDLVDPLFSSLILSPFTRRVDFSGVYL